MHALKAMLIVALSARTETTVIDIGSPADWVKINVRVTVSFRTHMFLQEYIGWVLY